MAGMQWYRRRPDPGGSRIRAVQVRHAFRLEMDGGAIRGRVSCDAGTWLAQSADGNLYPIPAALFGRVYEEVIR
jgi:hypothetical protein